MPILKGALSFHLKRCSDCSTRTVSNTLRDVVSEIHVEWRGRSFGSSVACELSTPSKVRRRLCKAERRAIVQSFVNRYRATNGGKLPGIKVTYKEVGGSFYIVREILQEIKFKSKDDVASPINEAETERNTSYKNVGADNRSQVSAFYARSSFAVVKPVFPASSPSADEVETDRRTDPVDISDPISNGIKGASKNLTGIPVILARDQLPTQKTKTIPQEYVHGKQNSHSHLLGKQTNVVSDAWFKNLDPDEKPSFLSENFKTCSDQEVSEETSSTTQLVSENQIEENEMRKDGEEPKRDHHQGSPDLGNATPLEEEKGAREVSDRGVGDVQTAKKAGFWSNVKSLADRVVKFWREG